MSFPAADALTVNNNWNITVANCIFGGGSQPI